MLNMQVYSMQVSGMRFSLAADFWHEVPGISGMQVCGWPLEFICHEDFQS